ncbi:penicillin-binding protein 2 [Candidatus Parcubacteria bacterium]|nr:MAG: penicillin-binding protein 2 [Candidatus Parcubacteria bacterium]
MARFALVFGCVALAYCSLLFNLYGLQVLRGGEFRFQAESRVLTPEFLKGIRGTVYATDKRGNKLPIALNRQFPLIYAAPKTIDDALEAANRLAPVLGETAEALEVKLSKPDDSYELLVRKADADVARKVAEMRIQGVYVDAVPERFYPMGSLAAHVIGFVAPAKEDTGENGRYGVEEFFNDSLAGARGEVSENQVVAPTAGTDIVLTIEPNVQSEAERILSNLVKKHGAKSGSVIVGDPGTGKILAMGSYPDFDPNRYGTFPIEHFINPITQHIYEPGSGFKVITMAAGIDSGKVTPETTYVDTGSLTLNGRTIQNYDLKTRGPYGRTSMTSIIEHSINTGAVFVQRQIGRDLFAEYLKRFGLGEKTGITLPGELGGDLRRLNPKERDIAFATAAYGQGVAVTPLGLLSAIAAIANGGNLMRPYLDAALEPQMVRRVIREETAQAVTAMMVSAVDKAGVAKIEGYTLAGKTGTAYIPDFEKGGYTDRVINTYVGFGPASNARFIALIKLDDPEEAPVAALTVVPAFRELAQFILNYYDIPPDRLK